MKFNDVSKTGLRTQIRQRVPEIFHFSRRNPHKLDTFDVSKTKKKNANRLFIKNLIIIIYSVTEKIIKWRNSLILETSKVSSLWGLQREKWYISGTRWRIWVLRPVLETSLNSIRTFSTKILVPVLNSLSKLASKLTNGEKWLTLVQCLITPM